MSDVSAQPTPNAIHRRTIGGRSLPGTGERPGVGSDEDSVLPPAVHGFLTGRFLGMGGSASVWLVTDSAGQRFALKVAHHLVPAAPPDDGATSPVSSGELPPPSGTPLPGRRARRSAPASGGTTTPGGRAPGNGLSAGRVADSPPHSLTASAAPGRRDGGIDLERELRLLQRLDHEHLVRVYRVIDTDQGRALLLEFAAGGSLLELVRSRGPLPIAEVVTSLVPVAQALDHLHEAGALHGDVTPGNILFTHEGKPLLGDLGTGRLLGADPVAMPGTPGFIDPATSTTYDAGVDVFALAAVAWFALTGRIPGPTDQRPPLALIVPEVPDTLMQLIEDGLSADRERRPSAASFAGSLLAVSAPTPINLVPAVHASVRPDLLTRRSEPRPEKARSRWRRAAGPRPTKRERASKSTTSSRERGNARSHLHGPVLSGSSAGSSAGSFGGRSVPRADVVSGDRDLRGHRETDLRRRSVRANSARLADEGPGRSDEEGRSSLRRILAISSAGLAVLLLVVGIVLTVGGLRGPAHLLSEPAAQGGDASAPSAPEVEAAPTVGGPTGTDEEAGGSAEEPSAGTGPADRNDAGGVVTGGTEAVSGSAGPLDALEELVEHRASAFATGDPRMLRAVDVDGSPAMIADQEAVSALERTDSRLRDLSITLRDSTQVSGQDLSSEPALASSPGLAAPPGGVEVAVVRATAQISSYTTETGSEATEGTEAPPTPPLMAAGRQELLFVLWDTVDGWRIHSVVEPSS